MPWFSWFFPAPNPNPKSKPKPVHDHPRNNNVRRCYRCGGKVVRTGYIKSDSKKHQYVCKGCARIFFSA